jgi:hypothetical protein
MMRGVDLALQQSEPVVSRMILEILTLKKAEALVVVG